MNEGIAAPPFVTCRSTSASAGLSWSRFGPTFPVAPAAFSVWQPPQPAEAKICFPFGGAAWVPPPPPLASGAFVAAVTPQFGLPAHFAM